MKTILIFNGPDDEYVKNASLNGPNYVATLTDILSWLRSEVKYSSKREEESEEAFNAKIDAYDKVREKIYSFASDNNANLDI